MTAWQHRAACRRTDPDVFFNKTRAAEAQAVCSRCPVVADCNKLGGDMTDGIFAGVDRWQKQPGPSLTAPYLEEHGTVGGYARHLARNQIPCERCTTANLFDWHERQAVKPQKRRKAA